MCRGPVFLLPGLTWFDLTVVVVGRVVLLLLTTTIDGFRALAFMLYGSGFLVLLTVVRLWVLLRFL